MSRKAIYLTHLLLPYDLFHNIIFLYWIVNTLHSHHQEKKEKPEVRRHSRSSAIHPTYTTSPGDVHPPRLVNAVNKVMMQKHVTESMKKATQNPKRKTAKEQVWPRRNTHH